MWGKVFPDATNTGVLTRETPALDFDLLSADAVRAIVDYLHQQYDERGFVDVRTGLAPKCAVLFCTIQPFGKIIVNVVAPNGKPEKVEFLATGQQVVVMANTRKPGAHIPGTAASHCSTNSKSSRISTNKRRGRWSTMSSMKFW